MPQSFAAMYAHLVFSTKHRSPTIQPAWAIRMYEYLGGIVANRGGQLLASGGMPDHIHLLVSLGRKWSLSGLLRDVKAGSSKWIHDNFAEDRAFAWQNGFGALLGVGVEPRNAQAIHRQSAATSSGFVVFRMNSWRCCVNTG